jgi:hypothetical protein
MLQAQHDGALQADWLISSRGTSVISIDWERLQKEGYYSPDCLRQHDLL